MIDKNKLEKRIFDALEKFGREDESNTYQKLLDAIREEIWPDESSTYQKLLDAIREEMWPDSVSRHVLPFSRQQLCRFACWSARTHLREFFGDQDKHIIETIEEACSEAGRDLSNISIVGRVCAMAAAADALVVLVDVASTHELTAENAHRKIFAAVESIARAAAWQEIARLSPATDQQTVYENIYLQIRAAQSKHLDEMLQEIDNGNVSDTGTDNRA